MQRNNRIAIHAAMIGVLCAATLTAAAAEELRELHPPEQIEASGFAIDIEHSGHAAPFYGDFNEDGLPDLLVGEFFRGRLRVYPNVGGRDEPRFEHYVRFEAGGKPVTIPTKWNMGFTPQLADLDDDGRMDLITGSNSGFIYWFRRGDDNQFQAAELLKGRDGQPLKTGLVSTAFAVDWDEDGDLDLLVGTAEGKMFIVPNGGAAHRDGFAAPKLLRIGGKPMVAKERDIAPVAADWDNDGLVDVVAGTEVGSVLWFRNVGVSGRPNLSAPVTLVPPSKLGWKGDKHRKQGDWGMRTKVCVVDYNADGRLDLLVGDRCGDYQGIPRKDAGESEEEQQALDSIVQLRGEWGRLFRLYRRLQSETNDTADQTTALASLQEKLVDRKKQIEHAQQVIADYRLQRQSHGFVWLFLRK